MTWKLKPAKKMSDYSGIMKFYKVPIAPDEIDWHNWQVARKQLNAIKVEYRKWAWDNCDSTWAISDFDNLYQNGRMVHWFYIGFTNGEDKLMFRLAHDPEEVAMYKGGIKLFVRDNG